MKHLDFNHAWLFEYAKDEEWLRRAAKGRGQTVNLPHDFRISLPTDPASPGGANEAYFPGGYGYYEKRFHADEALLSGPCYLYFDGVYRMSELRLNNQLLCLHFAGHLALDDAAIRAALDACWHAIAAAPRLTE